jgi:small subunit ribosomal protein S13
MLKLLRKKQSGTIVNKTKNSIIIYGVRLHADKPLILALTILYGIGMATAKKLCAELGFSPRLYVRDLTETQQYLLIRLIKQKLRIENSLKDFVKNRIQLLIEKESYRGFRHRNRLPVRGQRSHSNAKTAKKIKR